MLPVSCTRYFTCCWECSPALIAGTKPQEIKASTVCLPADWHLQMPLPGGPGHSNGEPEGAKVLLQQRRVADHCLQAIPWCFQVGFALWRGKDGAWLAGWDFCLQKWPGRRDPWANPAWNPIPSKVEPLSNSCLQNLWPKLLERVKLHEEGGEKEYFCKEIKNFFIKLPDEAMFFWGCFPKKWGGCHLLPGDFSFCFVPAKFNTGINHQRAWALKNFMKAGRERRQSAGPHLH